MFQVENGGGVVLRNSGDDDYCIKLILPQDISLSRKEEVADKQSRFWDFFRNDNLRCSVQNTLLTAPRRTGFYQTSLNTGLKKCKFEKKSNVQLLIYTDQYFLK